MLQILFWPLISFLMSIELPSCPKEINLCFFLMDLITKI